MKNFNDKMYVRELLKDKIPVIKGTWINEELNYKEAQQIVNSRKFVMQERQGSGGNNTYLVESEKKLMNIKESVIINTSCQNISNTCQ